jgi:V/A-type H+-transporting ATPase subunit D
MTNDTASKTELLEHRAERELMREGKSVLEERRDLLAHMMLDQIRITEGLVKQSDQLFTRVREQVRRAMLRHGINGIQSFVKPGTGIPDAGWAVANRLGTPWLQHSAADAVTAHLRPTGGWEVSVELELVVAALDALLRQLADLAVAQNNLLRLVDVFRRTQRRVNALDFILLPEINHRIRNMEEAMDEMDRDDLVRTLLIKRQQAQ